jgi:hypothetical protein
VSKTSAGLTKGTVTATNSSSANETGAIVADNYTNTQTVGPTATMTEQ